MTYSTKTVEQRALRLRRGLVEKLKNSEIYLQMHRDSFNDLALRWETRNLLSISERTEKSGFLYRPTGVLEYTFRRLYGGEKPKPQRTIAETAKDAQGKVVGLLRERVEYLLAVEVSERSRDEKRQDLDSAVVMLRRDHQVLAAHLSPDYGAEKVRLRLSLPVPQMFDFIRALPKEFPAEVAFALHQSEKEEEDDAV